MANWHSKKIEYDSNRNPIYVGYGKEQNKSIHDNDWYLTRIIWSGQTAIQIDKKIGKWAERSIGW